MEKEPDHKEVLLELERRIGNLAWQLERLQWRNMWNARPASLFITYFLTGARIGWATGISPWGHCWLYLKTIVGGNLPAISDYMAHLIRNRIQPGPRLSSGGGIGT